MTKDELGQILGVEFVPTHKGYTKKTVFEECGIETVNP